MAQEMTFMVILSEINYRAIDGTERREGIISPLQCQFYSIMEPLPAYTTTPQHRLGRGTLIYVLSISFANFVGNHFRLSC
jgi:hypothetical protein